MARFENSVYQLADSIFFSDSLGRRRPQKLLLALRVGQTLNNTVGATTMIATS